MKQFHCCLGPEEGDFLENLHCVVCVIIKKCSLECVWILNQSSFWVWCSFSLFFVVAGVNQECSRDYDVPCYSEVDSCNQNIKNYACWATRNVTQFCNWCSVDWTKVCVGAVSSDRYYTPVMCVWAPKPVCIVTFDVALDTELLALLYYSFISPRVCCLLLQTTRELFSGFFVFYFYSLFVVNLFYPVS